MDITSVRIWMVEKEDPVVAYCSIVFEDCFAVGRIRIIKKDDRYSVAMPSMKNKQGQYTDVCFPINSNMRKKIEEAILRNYHAMLKSKMVDPGNIK